MQPLSVSRFIWTFWSLLWLLAVTCLPLTAGAQDVDPAADLPSTDLDAGTFSEEPDGTGDPATTADDADPGDPAATTDGDPGDPAATTGADPGDPAATTGADPGDPAATADDADSADPATTLDDRDPVDEAVAEAEEASGQLDVRADSVEFETDRSVYVMRDNVRIQKGNTAIYADWVVYSSRTQQGVATGNVLIEEGGDRLVAQSLHFELDGLKGIVYEGELAGDDSEFQMAGRRIKRVSDQRYIFDDATFTTCRCPKGEREPWRIRAEEADLNTEGYATTKNTKVDILGVPLMWTPWMRYPLKNDRQTGFLFPTVATSERSGFDVGMPFFWAIHDQVNLILEPRYLTKRGFKPAAEIEYIFGQESYGELFGSFIKDNDVDENSINTPFSENRWGVEWIHQQELPADFFFKVDARFTSDNDYAFDFQDFSRFRTDRFLEATGFVEGRFGSELGPYGFTGSAVWADDVSAPDTLDRDSFLVQRLPDLHLSGRPTAYTPLDWLLGSFDLRYTHFWAEEDVDEAMPEVDILGLADDVFADTGIEALPDGREPNAQGDIVRLDGTVELTDGSVVTAEDLLANSPPDLMPNLTTDGSMDNFAEFGGPEGDGVFQEGEPVTDRGHRVIMNPRLVLPFRVGDLVEVLPEVGWAGTFYSTNNSSSTIRSLFHANVDVRTSVRGGFKLPWIGKVKHVVQPSFKWTGITSDDQDDNPLFTPRPFVLQNRVRQLDPTAIVRDAADRIDAVNAITLGVNNRFYVPGRLNPEGIQGPARLLGDITFSFHNDFENDALRTFYVDGSIFPFPLGETFQNVRSRFNLGFDLDDVGIAEANLEVGYAHPAGHDVRLAYRYLEDAPRFFENFQQNDRFDDFEGGLVRINQIDFQTRVAITRHIGVTYRIAYSFEDSLVIANQIGAEYLSRCFCWALGLQLSNRRATGVEFAFQYRIIGLGEDTVRPFADSRQRTRRTDSLVGAY